MGFKLILEAIHVFSDLRALFQNLKLIGSHGLLQFGILRLRKEAAPGCAYAFQSLKSQ